MASSSSRTAAGKSSGGGVKIELSSVDIARMEPERRKNHEKQLKVIEDQMIQSKQDERALKRKEGDVKKEQRQIRQTVREFDVRKYSIPLEKKNNNWLLVFLNAD